MQVADKIYHHLIHHPFSGIISIVILIMLNGCALLSPNSPQTSAISPASIAENSNSEFTPGETGWWQASFHRPYKEQDEPAWHLDALVAYKIIKPILDNSPDVKLWRFHRRAAEDNSGQQFSFIFFSSRANAEQIYRAIQSSPLTQHLLQQHYFERLSFYDIDKKIRSAMEDTSDPHWPSELQKTWPFFIMGVSQTWLGLIEQYYQAQPVIDEQDLVQLSDSFKQVNDKINKLWELNGNHAFLHHLNALFGYQELYIVERKHMQF